VVAMRLGVAAAVTAASALGTACLKIDPYKGPTLVGYATDDAGSASVAPQGNIKLRFASSGFHLPDQLQIDNVDVMGHATSPCWGESGTGFAVMPMPRVSGDPLDGGVQAINSDFQATMTGPVVVQLKTTWSTRWSFAAGPMSMCSTDMAHTTSGSSTFTVFPDDHIVRHDVLTEANPNLEQLMPDRCRCADMPKADNAFILSSYWAFNRALFPTQFGGGDSGGGPEELTLGNFYDVSSPETAVCFDGANDQYQIATVWRLPPGDGAAKPNAAAVGFDTVLSHDLQKPILTKLDFPWDVHGALFIERSNCTAALKRTLDYTMPQKLTISSSLGTISTSPSELDGIYGGDPGTSGSPGIDVPDGTTTLSGGPLNGSFVVWLRFPRSVIVPTATRIGAALGWYVPQRINDREWLVWVQDALQPGEMITVQPN
jgi:hypothetical protein